MRLKPFSRPKSFSAHSFRLTVFAAPVLVAGVAALGGEPPRTVLAPSRLAEAAAEIRLSPAPGCTLGQECIVGLAADSRIATPDRRRLAVILDWPANLVVATRPDGAWHCRPFSSDQLVCLAKADELAQGQVSHLTVRLPASGEPKLCASNPKIYDYSEDGQTRSIRLLQAFAADQRRETRIPDGQLTPETRTTLAALAKEMDIPVDLENGLVAALIGATFNRQPVILPACIALVTPSARPAEGQGAAIAPVRPKAAPKDLAKEVTKPIDGFAARNGVPPESPPGPGLTPPVGAPGGAAQSPPDVRPPPPGTIVRGEPDAAILIRPWRIRPLQGLRRLLGD